MCGEGVIVEIQFVSDVCIFLFQLNPAFLNSNSTIHTWVFSAFAEIIGKSIANESKVSMREISHVQKIYRNSNSWPAQKKITLRYFSVPNIEFFFIKKKNYKTII